MDGSTFIYALTDPRSNDIRYVGKSNDPAQRLRHRIFNAKGGRDRPHCDAWIKGLLDLGLRPILQVVERVPIEEWQQAEKKWIEYFKVSGARLTNHTTGGIGAIGFTQMPEANCRRSEAMKRIWADPARRECRLANLRRAYERPEVIENRSRAGKLGYVKGLATLSSEERTQNAAKAAKVGHKRKLSDGRSEHAVMIGNITMSRPGHAARIGRKGGHALRASISGRVAIGTATQARWRDLQYRMRVSKSQRSHWANISAAQLSSKAYKAWCTRRARYGSAGRKSQ